jgi:hypothetical protein
MLVKVRDDDQAYDFVMGTWASQLIQYREKASGNQFATSAFGIAALFFAVPLPMLTGLSAVVGNADWLRWLTFGLSLGAALTTRYVADRAYGPRWVLYHRHTESLFEECQLYVESAGPYDPTQHTPLLSDLQVKNIFVTRVTDLQSQMTNQYDQIVNNTGAMNVNVSK